MILPTKQEWKEMLPSAKLRVFDAAMCNDCQYCHTCYDGYVCPYDFLNGTERFIELVKFKRRLGYEEE